MCPDLVAFSCRASAAMAYRKEKKKAMNFVPVTPGLNKNVSNLRVVPDPSRRSTLHPVEDTQPALIIRKNIFESFDAAVNNKPDGRANESNAKEIHNVRPKHEHFNSSFLISAQNRSFLRQSGYFIAYHSSIKKHRRTGIYTPLNFMSLLAACMVFRTLWSSASVMQQNK